MKLLGFIIIMLILVSSSFAVINISSCGTDLNTSDEIYNVIQNISTNATSCLNITSVNNITLNCNGNSLTSNSSSAGVFIIHTYNASNASIINCNFYHELSDGSIHLTNSNNITIRNNTDNARSSVTTDFVEFSNASNVNIYNNTINESVGAFLVSAFSINTNINIYNNNIFVENTCHAIFIQLLSVNTNINISNNNFNNNTFGSGCLPVLPYALDMQNSANITNLTSTTNLTFSHNNLSGMGIFTSSALLDSFIYNNSISNFPNIGMFINSNSTQIFNNIVFNSSGLIYLNITGSNNLIYNNLFNQSSSNVVFDNGLNNTWNTSFQLGPNIIGGQYLGGNYYSDYTGSDSLGYGIGSTPYTINGTSGSFDFLPLTNNISFPILILNGPSNNQYFNVSSVIFNWTTSGKLDSYLSNLTIDGILNITDIPTTNNTLTSQTVNGFTDGLHNWSVTSYNSSVSNSSTTQFFTIDTTPPSIALNGPANATYTNNTLVNFNFTQTDTLSPTSSCSLFLDNVLNSTNATTDNSIATIFPIIMSEGNHNWYISCTDLAGNTNVSEIRNLTVDTTPPAVVLNLPTNNSLLNTSSIDFNITQTDVLSPTSSCDIYINNTLNTTNGSVINGLATIFSISGFVDSNYNWYANCTDLAGNNNISEVRDFSIGTTPPSITLISPNNSITITSASNTYIFNAISSLNNTFNCSLLIESTPVLTQSTTNATNTSIIYAFSSQGTYHWSISCIDSYGNSNTSSIRTITYQQAGGGGGGGFVPPPSTPPSTPPVVSTPPTTVPEAISTVISDIAHPNGGTTPIIAPLLEVDNPTLLGLISPSSTIQRTSAINVILSELQGLEALYFNIPIFNLLNFGYIFILFIGIVIYFLVNQKKKGIGNIVLLLSAFVFLGIVIVTVALNEAVLWFGLRVLGK